MAEKRAWLTNPTTGEKLHAWSHVKSIFYNKATNILLKDKLDEMDKLIDEKIKKAMMSNTQINDQNKVPTSALAFAMNQAITQNKNAITQLNSELNLDVHVSSVIFTSGSFGYAVQLVGDFGTSSLGWSDTEIYFDREEGGRWRRVWTINPPAEKV